MKKKRTAHREKISMEKATPAAEGEQDARYEDLSSGQAVYSISLEEAPLDIMSFIPDYRYRFDGAKAAGGDEFIRDFTSFLKLNEYLVMDDNPTRAFAEGFRQAVAITALFIDSHEIGKGQPA